MTPDPLSVIKEALPKVPEKPCLSCTHDYCQCRTDAEPALAALAEIEKRLREAEEERDHWKWDHTEASKELEARAEKAEAERDEAGRAGAARLARCQERLREAEAERDEERLQVRVLRQLLNEERGEGGQYLGAHLDYANKRVAELEAALREIADDEEPNHYRRLQGIARRALGEAE